jgi:hypothetical protein
MKEYKQKEDKRIRQARKGGVLKRLLPKFNNQKKRKRSWKSMRSNRNI